MILLLSFPGYFLNWLFSIGFYLIGAGISLIILLRKMTLTEWFAINKKLKSMIIFVLTFIPVMLIIGFRNYFESFASTLHAQNASVSIYVKAEKLIHFYLSLGSASLMTLLCWLILILAFKKKT